MKKRNITIFVVCYFAYTIIYISRLNLSMAAPELRQLQVLDEVQYGLLGSVFSVIYATGRLLAGNISDRKPPVLLFCIGMVLSGISNILIGFLPPFIAILLLWCINALAQSLLWGSVLCVISATYNGELAKKRVSMMVTSVATGNIVGILLPAYLINRFDCGWAFIVPGFLTLMAATAVFFTIRTIPAPAKTATGHKSIPELLKNRGLRIILIPTFFQGVIKDNVTFWMTIFIMDRYGTELSKSAYSLLLIPVVGLIARLLYAPAYRLSGNREHTVSSLAFMICLVASVMLCVPSVPMLAASVALSIVYAATSMANTSFTSIYPMNFAISGNVATVGGIIDFCTYLGTGVASLVYGIIVDNWGYTPMFISWSVLSILSVFILHKLNHIQ